MKLWSFIVLTVLLAAANDDVKAGIITGNPITTTYVLPAVPVATSYQTVARNVNRVLVPHVHPVAYPGHSGGAWGGYPYNYRVGYGYDYPYGHVHNYGFGYPYGYGATVW